MSHIHRLQDFLQAVGNSQERDMWMEIWFVGMTIKDAEKEIIKRALKFYDENKTQTARSLGIAIRTLDNKIKEYGIELKTRQKEEGQGEGTPAA